MAHTSQHRDSAEIEREIEEDRHRIEEKITAIQQRISPGQILDEALTYVKSSGGGEYLANLGNSVKTNPVPVALMGVSLAWLMANPGGGRSSPSDRQDDEAYPLATVQGHIQRMGPPEADGTNRYSHFADSAGKRFKALTDETGRRAGHFIDESGETYRGFADATGRQIHDIRDEAGKLLEEASGWTAKAWRQLGAATTSAGKSASWTWDQAGRLNEGLAARFQDQPLIGGALAFAMGAAIGAAFPSTRTENEMMGEAADDVKKRLSEQASRTLDTAEDVASDVYEKAASVASDVHDVARRRIAEEANALRTGDDNQSQRARPH